ncbi:FkbM family methyltransferase [Roseibium polysiphoniae]|uniref:FkbM family methyltransferase n=1 Tax=Roseibium polysiphoniae TaxID=2571221 RepID=A0A944GUU2_9HYPH|nr:FkbM family methyltransferase [Roseibium polysiphoniae]MBS8262779.1 FkbM family methyltransferase [Roseibium polysiphoniae]
MSYPIKPTVFKENPYQDEWFDTDFIYSPDGIQSYPEHHCKLTFEKSLPYIENFRVALDIGCRDGEYSRYLQKKFERVYGFDVNRKKYFPYNVDLKKTTHFTCGLGDKEGTLLMSGGTHKHVKGKMKEHPVFTLDSFEFENVDYIKIDVEGYERRVLIGGEQTIRKYRPLIIIEQNDVQLPDEEPFAAKKWLEDLGYVHVATCPRGWDHIMQAPERLKLTSPRKKVDAGFLKKALNAFRLRT